MKKIVIALLLASLTGCAGNISRIAEDQRVVYSDTSVIDREMENVMTDVFTQTGLPWDEGSQETIQDCMSALKAEAEYMSSVIALGSTVPYYDYRASVKRTFYLINKLKRELDARVQIDGAVTKIGKYAYSLLVEKVLNEANRQKLNLASEEAKINKAANAADIADLKKLYDTMAPLVKTAMVTL